MKRPNYTLPLFETASIVETPTKQLRPYQERALRLARMHLEQGKKRILLVSPTRSGKMTLTAAIARSSTLPLLFICHRLELIDQCAEEMQHVGLTNVGIVRADDVRTNPSAMIQVASIATLTRRQKPWLGQKIIIVIDECHRAASESFRTLIDEYVKANPEVIIIGFTATPWRLDGKPLGEMFEVLETVATYQELLKNPSWLIAPDIYALPPPDLSQVRQVGSDYDEDEAATVMRAINGDVVRTWLARAHMHPVYDARGLRCPQKFVEGPRRRTFLFACNIAHSLELCTRFEAEGVRIGHLDGHTPETERRSLLKALAKGEIEILSNVNILLEGVNVPEAKCVSHVRPTKSLTLFRQSSCRILTPWNGVRPLLLDHAGNTDEHDPPHIDLNWSLSARPRRRGGAPPMKICKSCYAYVEAGKVVCPHCGADLGSSIQRSRSTQETDAELQLRNSEPDAAKRLFFDRQVLMAKSKGFKPGFASAKFKERYGGWPPREWGNAIQLEFLTDHGWQTQLSRRLERKAERERQEKREAEHLDGPAAPTAPTEAFSPENVAAVWKAKRTTPTLGSPEDVAAVWQAKKVTPSPEHLTENRFIENPFADDPEPESYDDDESFSSWCESQGIS